MFQPETDWIKKWAKYTPNRLLLREYERNIEWSYSEFNRRANYLAHYLTDDLKLGHGDRIAVFSKNRAEYEFLFAAAIKTGIILVPLNFRLMPRELDVLLEDAAPSALFYEETYEELVNELKTLETITNRNTIESLDRFLNDPVPKITEYIPSQPITQEDIVLILYTSGTTGIPKGAIINHRMLFWNALNTELRLDLTSEDHTQNCTPFFHTGGWNVLVTPFLHHGASHTLLQKFDPDLALELIEKERTTVMFCVPTMLQMMVESPLFEKTDFSSLRYFIVGGAPMPVPLINLWQDKGVWIRQGYGLTEVGPNCFSLHQDDAIRKRGSIGFPNFYVDAKIVDDKGNEVGSNTRGELWLRSPVVTPGYWNKPEQTAEAITDGWFHTGDMVTRDDEDFYYVVDRKKNMFISGGENVYPADVERFLYTHPAIREVAVLGVPDEKWGEVGKAFLSVNQGHTLTHENVLEFCKGNLAKFKIPKYTEFLDDLPKNDAGKINRLELQRLTIEGS